MFKFADTEGVVRRRATIELSQLSHISVGANETMSETLNPFAIAQAQLDKAAAVLQLDPDMHAFLREPMR